MVSSFAFTLAEPPSPDRFTMFATGLLCLAVAALHRSIRLSVAVAVLSVGIGVSTTVTSIYTGGLNAPGALWLATIPLTAGLLAGRRGVIAGLLVAITAISGLMWADAAHLTYNTAMSSVAELGTQLGNLIGVAIVMSLAMLMSDMVFLQVTRVMAQTNQFLQNEVDDHESTRRKLEDLYCELVDIARQAGMGQVATGVLHNVGNALNGVTTSVALATIEVDQAAPALERLAALVEQPELTLEKRQTVAAYLRRLDSSLGERLGRIRAELVHIRETSEHVATIVTAQQELATTSGMVERVPLSQVVDQAHLLLTASLLRHKIELSLDIPSALTVTIDRHRAVQILTNLLANSRDALREATGDRRMHVRAIQENGWITIDVTDTGLGVPEKVAARVFEHGFTTKSDGHGFGLHSSALAATEMGGSLELLSSSTGAHFLLKVPDLGAAQTESPSMDHPHGYKIHA